GIHCISKFPSIYIQLFWNTLTHDAKTGRSLLHDNIVPKPDLALELGKSISFTKLKKKLCARRRDSFIVSKKRSSDSTKKFKGVPDESTISLEASNVKNGSKTGVPDEEKLNLEWEGRYEPGKTTMETEVESMVIVPIQQVSSSVPLLILQSSISHLLNQYLLHVKNHSLQLSPPTSTKMVRETLSHADAESGGNLEKINSETDTEILNVGSNSKQSHVALAGPNPEHMQDVFLATNYPKWEADDEEMAHVRISSGPEPKMNGSCTHQFRTRAFHDDPWTNQFSARPITCPCNYKHSTDR
ncbi:hypothetical protein Tco_1497934, partial [Tanacetum coccineum]